MSVVQSTAVNGGAWVTITIGVADGMEERWWKMRPATLSMLAGALLTARRDALWPRLLGPMCGRVKDGCDLDDTETAWVDAWLLERGRGDLSASDVQVFSMTWDQAADAIGMDRKAAQRAFLGLQDTGVINLVRKGHRGRSSLYAVMPLPDAPGDRE